MSILLHLEDKQVNPITDKVELCQVMKDKIQQEYPSLHCQLFVLCIFSREKAINPKAKKAQRLLVSYGFNIDKKLSIFGKA
jgi:hypothetical protein